MAGDLSAEQLEELLAQLPPSDRLKLAAHICEQLSTAPSGAASEDRARKHEGREVPGDLGAWLAERERVADLWDGEFDSAADLRRIRDER